MSEDPKRKRKLPKGLDQKTVDAEVRRLKQKQGWNPASFVTPDALEKMRGLNQQVANAALYDESAVCQACATLRQDTGDETALCAVHLAEAMGF